MKKLSHYFSLLFVCLSSICMAHPEEEVIVYKQTEQADLSMTILRPELTQKSKKGTPTILFFFGGGWRGGTIEQFRPQAEMLRDKGMIAILVEYRTFTKHNTLPDRCIEDAKSAMRYVRENAKALGVNPKMIACSGGSAGGHLAAATAFIDKFNSQDDNLKVSSIPNALVLFNPVIDNSPEEYNTELLDDLSWAEISPSHNIGRSAPPTIFFVGDQDIHLSIKASNEFMDKIEATGAISNLHVYEGCEHSFFNNYKHDGKYFRITMNEVIEFLTGLGYLK